MNKETKALFDKYKRINIDLGCGQTKNEGFIGVDMEKHPGVDIVQDLEEFPWNIPYNSADLIVASHLVEHINPAKGGFIKFMDEAWRVLKPGGKFMISLPYAGSRGYWQDPTHINGCNEVTWTYFDPLDPTTGGGLYAIYKPLPWKIEHNTYMDYGNMEVSLIKRKIDPSYGRKEDGRSNG